MPFVDHDDETSCKHAASSKLRHGRPNGVLDRNKGFVSCSRGRSRNRHNGDGTTAKFLADARSLAAIRSSPFRHDGNLNPTALSPTAIENHLSVRVVREPLQQIIVQCPMPQRHEE
jgi:hypothetical protein